MEENNNQEEYNEEDFNPENHNPEEYNEEGYNEGDNYEEEYNPNKPNGEEKPQATISNKYLGAIMGVAVVGFIIYILIGNTEDPLSESLSVIIKSGLFIFLAATIGFGIWLSNKTKKK